jgi:hypothetical protein
MQRRYRQLFAAIEDECGVAQPLVLGDFIRVADLGFTPSQKVTERNLSQGDDTKHPHIVSGQTVEFTMGIELAGHTSGASTAPVWGRLLRGCGFHQVATQGISIGAVTSGPFRHLETVTGGTSSATARVIGNVYNGDASVRFVAISGTLVSGEVLTGGTSGATATTSSVPGTSGQAWYPTSQFTSTFTTTATPTGWAVGEEIFETAAPTNRGVITEITGSDVVVRMLNGYFGAAADLEAENDADNYIVDGSGATQYERPTLSMVEYLNGRKISILGARGQFSISQTHGEHLKLDATFQGVLASDADGQNVSGVSYPYEKPPVFQEVGFTINDGTNDYAARFTTLGIEVDNGIVVRENANSSVQGYDVAHIQSREISGSFNPDEIDKDVMDFGNLYAQGSIWRAGWTVGSTAGNTFRFSAPYGQFNGQSEGDRDGVFILDNSFRLTGGENVYPDSELVIHLT